MQTERFVHRIPARTGTPQFVCRILIVDTDRQHSDAVSDLGQRMGHQLRRAYRGATGIDIARQFLPDIVLIDLSDRPKVRLAVAKAIRAAHRGRLVHLVALTKPQADPSVFETPVEFDSSLAKPVEAKALREILGAWCNQMGQWRKESAPVADLTESTHEIQPR